VRRSVPGHGSVAAVRGSGIVIGGLDVSLYDTADGRLRATHPDCSPAVGGLDFGPDGPVRAVSGPGGKVRLWELAAAKDTLILPGTNKTRWPWP
jgi:hypothetical protein